MALETETLPYQGDGLFMVHASAVLCLDFSHDGRILASGDKSGSIKVWKVSDGKCLRQIAIQLGADLAAVTTVKLNPSNAKVYAACLDKSIKVFGLKSGSLLKEFVSGHEDYI